MSNETIYQIARILTVQKDSYFFDLSSFIITVLIILLLLYLVMHSSLPTNVFKYLSIQHILAGYIHVLCITFYIPPPADSSYQVKNFYNMLEATSSRMDLILVFTTSCIAWIIFLRLFLFRDGEELYDIKGVLTYLILFLGMVQGYEELANAYDCDKFLRPILRLTSIFLYMCISLFSMLVTFICLISNLKILSKPRSLFSLLHLFLLVSSDILLVKFNFDTGTLIWLWNLLLYVRLVIEIVWYFIHDYVFKEYIF